MKEANIKLVVVGGTGRIGSKVFNKLREHGHEAVAASPNTGVNTVTGEGLAEVLEGSVVMLVRGGKEVTLTPGRTFYEGPNDVHVVGRNASKTKPAKVVVFFLKNKGAPIPVPAK